jgi:uncharacterized surface protein with fasciclin (FAS1) repeats
MGAKLVAAAAVIGISLTAAAWGSGVPSAAAVPGHASHSRPPAAKVRAHTHPSAKRRVAARVGLFGTQCAGALPPGTRRASIRRLAALPVATAIARTPVLSQLARAIQSVGLTKTLNSASDLTVFAPANSAFASIGTGTLQVLLASKPELEKVLTFQIVRGRVTTAELAHGRVLSTLGGTKIYPSRAGPSYQVNNAWILCGNIHTANATVYVVNRVVIPDT